MDPIRIYDLHPSPNNMKVRIALAAKGIPFELVPVDPQERGPVVEATGQPLTPAMVHGDVRLFDSGAILRYLDANFRDHGPRLYSPQYEVMKAIEGWEAYGREHVNPAIGLFFQMYLSGAADEAKARKANQILDQGTERIETELSKDGWLVGSAMTAADVCLAPFVYYGMVDAEDAAGSRVAAFAREHLRLGAGRERTRAWVRRVMSYDRR